MQSTKLMPTPGGIGAGQTATLNLPIGSTYEALSIRLRVNAGDPAVETDVTAGDWENYIDEIRLVVNGNTTYQISAKAQVYYNQTYGVEMVPGILPIPLSRPWMRTIGGEDQTAYKTASGVDTFTMEIDLKDGIDIVKLRVYADQSAGVAPWGAHLRMQRFHQQNGLVGVREISDLPRSNYTLLALHLDSDKIDDIEVNVNNVKVVQYDKPMREAVNVRNSRAIVSGWSLIDFQSKRRAIEAMPMNVQDFRLKLDFTEATQFVIYAESIVGAQGL